MAGVLPFSCFQRRYFDAPDTKCGSSSLSDCAEPCSSSVASPCWISSRYDPRRAARGVRIQVAAAVARNSPRIRNLRNNPGPALSPEQLAWERMMLEVEKSPEPLAILKKYAGDGNISRESVVGTLTRFKQMQAWKIIIKFTEWLMEQGWYNFNQKDYFLVLLAYCKDGQVDKTEGIFQRMAELGVAANIEMYTLQIEGYGRRRSFDKAEAVFQRLLTTGPSPTAQTYQTMMKSYSEAGRLDDVQRIFKLVTDSPSPTVKPDARMYNLMIHTYGKQGKVEQAMSVYQSMKRERVALTIVTFNSLLACQKTWKDAEDVFRKLQAAKLDPDVFSYTALVNAYAKARRAECAHAAFDDMIAAGIRPTQVAYNALINAYAKCKDPEGARAVLKQMKQNGCTPTVESYTSLISAYVSVNLMAKAEQTVLRMKEADLQPNLQTFCILMTGYANGNKLDNMMRSFETMKLAGLEPNRHVYTVLVNAYGSNDDFDSAIIWYKQMLGTGCKPDPILRTVLLKIAKSHEQTEEIHELLGMQKSARSLEEGLDTGVDTLVLPQLEKQELVAAR
ncbi:hypothetical protein SELMODRAFT_448320 [Selaginella moellendorffii]|uniref:Pentacotripeptide-repeat region of PRORP domain-containing protein n=1 Tax=Selaginella moellendorffii TaxID=88036 RepID=D8T6H1_SELML|nr:pentatricopeptide repeat-containing protein At3g59040 [Selaginella moellendorffii]EFJ07723.1 hypothetical protein SELMODRAFT_448320 [Selaginella moellendorffii]|eukprot:XP_024520671.1 pentatricopeptide repeat-containing protein At3g59040 [Selaginella moellendorffii]